MRRLILLAVLTVLMACDGDNESSIYSGEVITDDQVKAMQESWCKYNEGRDFAKEQCEEFWNE